MNMKTFGAQEVVKPLIIALVKVLATIIIIVRVV